MQEFKVSQVGIALLLRVWFVVLILNNFCPLFLCHRLYCDCFRNGKVCISDCGCTACQNTVKNSGPRGIRTKTITEILRRRPDAFDKREKKAEGCSCKKVRGVTIYILLCHCPKCGSDDHITSFLLR